MSCGLYNWCRHKSCQCCSIENTALEVQSRLRQRLARNETHAHFSKKTAVKHPLIKKKLSDGLVEPFLFVPVNLAPLSLGTPTSHASSGSSHLAPAQDAHAEGHGLGWPTWFQKITTQVNSYVINHAWYILRCPLFQGIWSMIWSGWDWLGDQTQGSRS